MCGKLMECVQHDVLHLKSTASEAKVQGHRSAWAVTGRCVVVQPTLLKFDWIQGGETVLLLGSGQLHIGYTTAPSGG